MMIMRPLLLLSILVWTTVLVSAFIPLSPPSTGSCGGMPLFSTTADETTSVSIDPKEAVKLFGRLAEKYIALDSSAGACCYSACTDCEWRLPGGGYQMADQSASRPKWIPNYESRNSNNREHVTVWSSEIFTSGPAVEKDEFVERLTVIQYTPPLGGPYVGASAGGIDDATAAEHLFDVLAEGKTKLTKHKMSVRLKELADGEEGLIWPAFQRAMGLA